MQAAVSSQVAPWAGLPGRWWVVPAGLDPRAGTLQPQGHRGALDQGTKETRVGFGMEGGAGRQKITVGRVKGMWSQRGQSADGGMGCPLMGEWACGLRRGPVLTQSRLWRCGISGRARGHPRGSSRCHPPQWRGASHSPGRSKESALAGRPPHPRAPPPSLHWEARCFTAQPCSLCIGPATAAPPFLSPPLSPPVLCLRTLP